MDEKKYPIFLNVISLFSFLYCSRSIIFRSNKNNKSLGLSCCLLKPRNSKIAAWIIQNRDRKHVFHTYLVRNSHIYTLWSSAIFFPAHISFTIRYQRSHSVLRLASKTSFLDDVLILRVGILKRRKATVVLLTSWECRETKKARKMQHAITAKVQYSSHKATFSINNCSWWFQLSIHTLKQRWFYKNVSFKQHHTDSGCKLAGWHHCQTSTLNVPVIKLL